MAKPSWLSDNTHRAFPLIDPADAILTGPSGPAILPFSALADFACVLGPSASEASVFFRSVSRASNVLSFSFAGTGVLASQPLVFTRPITAPEFATDRQTILGNGIGPDPCVDELIWEGCLTTGSLAEVAALLANGQTLTATDLALPVEPICIQWTRGGSVTSLNLANQVRTLATTPSGCSAAPTPPFARGTIVAQATCLSGALTLKAGYNCRIDQDSGSSTLTISAGLGAGEGTACEEVAAYPGESPPEGSTLLSGGPTCSQVISSINGQSSAVLNLIAGVGVTVAPSQSEANTLVATASGQGLATCT